MAKVKNARAVASQDSTSIQAEALLSDSVALPDHEAAQEVPFLSAQSITKDHAITKDHVEAVYLALLGRMPESEDAINYHINSHVDVQAFCEFVLSTPSSRDYLAEKLGPESVASVLKQADDLGDYAFFFFLMRKYLPVWHSSNLVVFALLQFINVGNRAELVERFKEAATHNDMSYLTTGENMSFANQPPRFQLPLGVLERYQDVRVEGVTYASGVRGCEERYQFIRSIAVQFTRPFSVLDLGANLGYFAVRLVEEFDCIVVCCEGTYARWLTAIVSKAARGRIVVLSKTMTILDLEAMAECETFDLVLAMSVVHHVNGPVPRTVAALRKMAWKLIVEFPTEQTACGQDRVAEALTFDWAANGGQLLGHSFSHLVGDARPTILFDGWASAHERAYMFSVRPCNVEIKRDWHSAAVIKDGEERPYLPALNLHSYLCFDGIWPVPRDEWSRDLVTLASQRHGDIMPWNFLIHTGGLRPIDYHTDHDAFFNPDGLGRGVVEDIINWASYTPQLPADTEIILDPSGKAKEILAHGFINSTPNVMRPASDTALMVLYHEFMPQNGLDIELSIRPSPELSIAVYGNEIECILSRDAANPDFERLSFHVTAAACLKNYPLLLRFYITSSDQNSLAPPEFYSLCYRIAAS